MEAPKAIPDSQRATQTGRDHPAVAKLGATKSPTSQRAQQASASRTSPRGLNSKPGRR
jgi:hypothetical protein